MRFLVDENLSRRLVQWFIDKSHVAEHVDDVLGKASGDQAIVAYARAHGAVIVSKDYDFVDILVDQGAPAVLWIRTGNTRTNELLARFDAEWPRIQSELQTRAIVEVS